MATISCSILEKKGRVEIRWRLLKLLGSSPGFFRFKLKTFKGRGNNASGEGGVYDKSDEGEQRGEAGLSRGNGIQMTGAGLTDMRPEWSEVVGS